MERRCQKINIFIFGMLLPWISTFGAARRDKKQKVVHKDRRAAMLQKGRKMSADSEFCERQRNDFATGGNNQFFVGCDIIGQQTVQNRYSGKVTGNELLRIQSE